ncbi:MAG: hypothetical protein IJP93_03950, partial [Bacteroidales bacterium]|nr:hypothetical protein [Bacteroidales bacterium]MBR0083216.1 hypothetical protein [Bacteroidales bacterium]
MEAPRRPGKRPAEAGPVILSRQTNTCDSYVQKWVAADAALHNRTPYVEWPSVWMCSASHC